jgi:hypothetical protein
VRRLLSAELRVMLEGFTVVPHVRLAMEEIEADQNWKTKFAVTTPKERERLLRLVGFRLLLKYRNGHVHVADPIDNVWFRLPISPQMNRMRHKMQLKNFLLNEFH